MRVKISTPSAIIFDEDIQQIKLPTEKGELLITNHQKPIVHSLIPWLIHIKEEDHLELWKYINKNDEILLSIDKWMVFVDGKMVRILCNEATITPTESETQLQEKKLFLEEEIKKLRKNGSIEDQERGVNKLLKINADILLEHTKQTS